MFRRFGDRGILLSASVTLNDALRQGCSEEACTQCPQRLEESVGAFGTVARVIRCHVGPLEEQPVFLAAKAALQYGLC